MKTILLPTDFSNNSMNAIDYAMHMFRDIECRFYILNVQKASSFVSDDLMTASPSVNLYQAIIDASKKSLINIIKRIDEKYNNPKHELVSIVDYDNFIDSINQTCKVKQVDLIIMGTKGASGFEKVIFGSNTVRVMQRGQIPVLAIPNNYSYKSFEKAALISDYLTEYKKNDISAFVEIVERFNSRVDILYVSENKDLTRNQQENINLMDEYLKGTSHDFIHLEGTDVYKKVSEYVMDNEINLLAMVNRKHSFLERLLSTQKVEEFGSRGEIPILVMHS